ncbi:hypothetical protein MC28_E078 (plasmid) [Bacillus thuringiensis MC28]|nr:hypothetical protein MC28_E078 [Bacillus thuringiensis MC28]
MTAFLEGINIFKRIKNQMYFLNQTFVKFPFIIFQPIFHLKRPF